MIQSTRLAMSFSKFAILCIFLTGLSASALADPIVVSYTVSGSSGAWVLDFSLTNNVNSGQVVFFFGVLLPAQDILNSPAGSVNTRSSGETTWNPSTGNGGFSSTGPNLTYNNLWRNFSALPNGGIAFGNTLSGFDAGVSTLVAPTSVEWFAYAIDVNFFSGSGTPSPYTGAGNFTYTGDCIGNGFTSCAQESQENPGFAGAATPSTIVAEPNGLLLLASGLLGLAGVVRRKWLS